MLKYCFSEKLQQDFMILEEKFNWFFYCKIFEIAEKLNQIAFLKKVITFFKKTITFYVTKVIFFSKEIFFVIFLIIPWIMFIFSFLYDFFKGSFYYSVFFLANYFFLFRISSIFLFITRNSLWEDFDNIYYKNCSNLYFSTITSIDTLFLNRQFLVNLMFLEEFRKNPYLEKLSFWKIFNDMLFFFLPYITIKTFWQNRVPLAKTYLNSLTLLVIILGICFNASFVLGCWFLFVLPFLVLFTYKSFYNENTYIFDEKIRDFFEKKELFFKDYEENLISMYFFKKEDFSNDRHKTFLAFPTNKVFNRDNFHQFVEDKLFAKFYKK